MTHPALIRHGAGTLRENGHDQDNRQCPIEDALTLGSMGYRRTRALLFSMASSVVHVAPASNQTHSLSVEAAVQGHQASVSW